MNDHLSASEAAQLLGVSLSTLYSYVSRGLLDSVAGPGARSKRYPYDAVQRLAARKADGKRAGHMTVAAMNWGVPVMETRITQLADGKLFFRGQDSWQLADSASLETLAQILWESPDFPQSLPALNLDITELALQLLPHASPLQKAIPLLTLLAHQLPAREPDRTCFFTEAATLMRILAALLLNSELSCTPLHEQVARTWQVDARQANLIRSALVLMADHELNASTFSVRCVASTGADLAVILSTGLSALSGPIHGGGSALASQMLTAALHAPSPVLAIQTFYTRHEAALAGFSHPLYPDGDPRAIYLLNHMGLLVQDPIYGQRIKQILDICDHAAQYLNARPNADFALAALQTAFNWPEYAAQILFALARSVGWIAHAAEQMKEGRLIRPRARYVGDFHR